MSAARFYLPSDRWSSDTASLEDEEAKHCAQVIRRGLGDKVVIFDGLGNYADATIVSASARRVDLTILQHQTTPRPSASVVLIQAIPKGSNMELIIEKAVELGVNAIQPVFTERTVVRLDAKESVKKQQKWQRIALEACKQCGQNWLPVIHQPKPFSEACHNVTSDSLKLIAALQDDAMPLRSILDEVATTPGGMRNIVFTVGPEGDFTPAEYTLARSLGFLPLSLGPITLRVETATLYGVSILQHEIRNRA
jgi:16S rRNA (uracil1498-N3)-methyltransferase